ncbi:MAG: hypothetical protein ACNA8P_00570 [Phycisphaerales bacterium]
MKKSYAGATIAAVVGLTGASASGQTVTYNAALGGGLTPFLAGAGNTNTNFVINTVDLGNDNFMELAIKAKKRQGPDDATPSYSPGSYSVQPGLQDGVADRWWWNYDYSLDFRESGLAIGDIGIQTVFNFEGQGQQVLEFAGQSVFTPGSLLEQGSVNFGFGFLSYLGYNPDAVGTYTITINVFDLSGGNGSLFPIGSVTMQAVVIPLPGAAGMALAGMGLIGLRRRR